MRGHTTSGHPARVTRTPAMVRAAAGRAVTRVPSLRAAPTSKAARVAQTARPAK